MHQRLLARILALISTATLVCQTALASGPVTSSDTTPGAMGSPQALLHWSAEEKVAGFPAIDTYFQLGQLPALLNLENCRSNS